jgi:hypothetical protein
VIAVRKLTTDLASSALAPLVTSAAIEVATGNIIKAVDVFDTHMLSSAVAIMTPSTRRAGSSPTRATML